MPKKYQLIKSLEELQSGDEIILDKHDRYSQADCSERITGTVLELYHESGDLRLEHRSCFPAVDRKLETLDWRVAKQVQKVIYEDDSPAGERKPAVEAQLQEVIKEEWCSRWKSASVDKIKKWLKNEYTAEVLFLYNLWHYEDDLDGFAAKLVLRLVYKIKEERKWEVQELADARDRSSPRDKHPEVFHFLACLESSKKQLSECHEEVETLTLYGRD